VFEPHPVVKLLLDANNYWIPSPPMPHGALPTKSSVRSTKKCGSSGNVLAKARPIAANIAKLPGLCTDWTRVLSYAAKSLATLLNRIARHLLRGFSCVSISTAALTRLPLADAVSGSEANTKHE
jgi:hypothetical protein